MLTPYELKRPTRTSDGMGGFTESLPSGSVLYGTLVYQENEPFMLTRRESDIQRGDIIVVQGEDYRVLQVRKIDGGDTSEVSLERTVKPI